MVMKHSLLKMMFAGLCLSNGIMFAENLPGDKLDARFTKLVERAAREREENAPSAIYYDLMEIRNAIDEKTMEDFGEQKAAINPEGSFIYEMGQRKVSIYYAHCKNAGKGEFDELDRVDDRGFTSVAPNLANRYGREGGKYLLRMMMAISDKNFVQKLLGVDTLEGLQIKKTFYLEKWAPYQYGLGGAIEVYERLSITYSDQQKCDVFLSYTFMTKDNMPVDLVRMTYWGVQQNGSSSALSKSGLILYQGELVNPTDDFEDGSVAPAAKKNMGVQQAPASGRRHHRRARPVNNNAVRSNKVQMRSNRQQQPAVQTQEVAPAKNSNMPHFGGRNNRHWRTGGRTSASSKQNTVLMEAVDENGDTIWIIDNTPSREFAPAKPRHGLMHLSN
jgi:hypothetical protein